MAPEQVGEWFVKWHATVRSWLRKRVDNRELDDLAQQVFLKLLRGDTDAEFIENPRSYIFKTAKNVLTDWKGLHRVSKPHSEDLLEPLTVEEHYAPDQQLDQSQLEALVRLYVSTLPPQQEDFLLLYLNGMTYKQIAVKRRCTYRMVLRELTTAYAELRFKFTHDPALVQYMIRKLGDSHNVDSANGSG